MQKPLMYYGFLDGIEWERILNIKDYLENDLKGYIAEIIELRQQSSRI